MNRKEFISEWDRIVSFNLIDILNFNELEDMPEIADRFYNLLMAVYNILSKLKHNKFYNHKELETVFYLVREDLYSVNDLLIHVNDKSLPSLIYEIVFNIFEELLLFCEDEELYETAQNLMNFRDYWFSHFGVKIVKVGSEQK